MNIDRLLNNPYVNWVLLQGKQSLKNTASLFIGDYVYRGGLVLSKEVLQVSVGHRTAKLQVVEAGNLKKILPLCQSQNKRGQPGPRRWDHHQSLTDHNFVAL